MPTNGKKKDSLLFAILDVINVFEKLFGGTEFQNRFKKYRKHLLNLGSLEKDCFRTDHLFPSQLTLALNPEESETKMFGSKTVFFKTT